MIKDGRGGVDIDREDISFARSVVENCLPEPEVRNRVLTFFGRAADVMSKWPATWSVSVKSSFIVFYCDSIIALKLRSDRLSVLYDLDSLGAELKAWMGETNLRRQGSSFKSSAS